MADTLVAMLAGLVIFPAVFANGLDPASGPGLIFQTLPVALAQMPGGHLVSIMFFLLLSVAAVTSMVGLIEPLVHRAQERGWNRHRSTLIVVSAIAACSVVSVLGYNLWSGALIGNFDINGLLDFFANQMLLPLGGLFIAVFAGWFVLPQLAQQELNLAESTWLDAVADIDSLASAYCYRADIPRGRNQPIRDFFDLLSLSINRAVRSCSGLDQLTLCDSRCWGVVPSSQSRSLFAAARARGCNLSCR